MKIFESSFPDDFRNKDIEQILGYVTKGKFCQLICIPGVGKATILRLLAHNRSVLKFHLGQKEKNLIFIYLNLHDLTRFDEAEIIKFMLVAMDLDITNTNDPIVLVKILNETINKIAGSGQTLVLLFDHFDEYQNRLPRSFFQMLKSAGKLARYKFSVVFATRRDLQELVDEQIIKDFWDFFVGNAIYLEVYDSQANDFMFTQVEKVFSKKLTKEQKSAITKLTGGHAKLTKIIAELSLSQDLDLSTQTLLQNSQLRASLFEIWLFLTSQEQKALYSISQNQQDIDSKVLDGLVKFDLINEKFSFKIPLFGEFIKTLKPEVIKQKISYDKTTKEITKGENNISELLSPQEFRVLKFFIENAKRIVTREEIIEAGWPHTEATDAISDEAIDQMIFRLRKKIEVEPRNPVHIVTVKGHGFKFEP